MQGAMIGDGWSIAVKTIGDAREPVVIIDHFAPDPQMFVDDAAMLRFAPVGIHYPGVRAPVARAMLNPLLGALAPVIRETFGYISVEIDDIYYSLVTTPPADLTPIQRMPHFDGVEDNRLALLHYLSPSAGGTAFYRHRRTGFDSITETCLRPYRESLDRDIAQFGMPEPGYIVENTAIFEQNLRVEGVFNRALLYRGNLLHCAWLPDPDQLVADVCQGRLTLNTFLRGGHA